MHVAVGAAERRKTPHIPMDKVPPPAPRAGAENRALASASSEDDNALEHVAMLQPNSSWIPEVPVVMSDIHVELR